MKNPINRRAFLGRIAAVPIAGSELKKHAAKLVGLGKERDFDDIPRHALGLGNGLVDSGPRGRSLLNWLRLNGGLPAWKKQELDRWAKGDARRRLDPDLASMTSISLSAAVNIQYERNLKKNTDEFYDNIIREDDRRKWLSWAGLDWF